MGKRWTIERMNEFCEENAIGYSVLETKYIQKSYQNQLWGLIKCPNINHEPYWVCWNNFTKGYRCKTCFLEQENKELWDKDKAFDFFYKNGYTMLNRNDFEGADISVYCHDNDGFIYKISITNLKRAIKNNYGFSIIKNNDYAIENIRLYCSLYRPDYKLLSTEYMGVKELHLFEYIGNELKDDVDKTFLCTIDNFINGNVKHPSMSISKGELCVKLWLEENNIEYIQQYTFDNCRDKQVLPFDFYLPTYNSCIEYQGKQHYEAIEYFGGQEKFELQQKHDTIKNEYCKNNGIPLLRIPYYKYNNIEEELNNFLFI